MARFASLAMSEKKDWKERLDRGVQFRVPCLQGGQSTLTQPKS